MANNLVVNPEDLPRIRLTSNVEVLNSNYDALTNRPSINNVTLTGNKTSADLGVQPTLVSGTNIKTLNNESLLGSGNIDINSAEWGSITGTMSAQTDLQDALNTKVEDVKINGVSKVSNKVANIETVSNLTSALSDMPLAASQGKLLNDRIDNLMNQGRFLALWNTTTGLPVSNPPGKSVGETYEYKTGDYYRVSVVGTTNYKPNGSSYVVGTASSTVESDTIKVGDEYFFDGTSWNKQESGGGGNVLDVQVNGTSILSQGIANIEDSTSSTPGLMTAAQFTKLGGIEAGAQVNAPNTVIDANYVHTDNNYTTSDSTKLAGIEAGAEVNNPATLLYTAMSITDAQKEQAVHNIGLFTEDTTDNWSTYSGNADCVNVVEA